MTGQALEFLEDLRLGRPQNIMDLVDLIQLIIAGKQRTFREHFEKYTPIAPQIHFKVVIAISH